MRVLLILASALLVSACGTKGPLYMPTPAPGVQKPAPPLPPAPPERPVPAETAPVPR